MVKIVGIILAGGLARRMGGGDKGLARIGGRPILDHVIARVSPQLQALALNLNGAPGRLAYPGLPILPDGLPGFPGPLAGILAGMDWAQAEHPDADWLASFPTDTPFLPHDLVPRLAAAAEQSGAAVAYARSGGSAHPVVALWKPALAEELRRALTEEGLRKVGAFATSQGCAWADWPDRPVDPFFNVNSPEDLAEAERLTAQLPPHQ